MPRNPSPPYPSLPQREPAGQLPLDLQMDLLIDNELPEEGRRAVLQALDREPGENGRRWRELALRFLQHQTERQGVRQLMAGGNLLPAQVISQKNMPVIGWVGTRRILATAAGLLIAATSALVTLYLVRPPHVTSHELSVNIPAEAVGFDQSVTVPVPLVKAPDGPQALFPVNDVDLSRESRQSWILQSDGKGGAVIVPVNTGKATVY